MITALVSFLVMVLFDRTTPFWIRLFGVGEFPLFDRKAVADFNRRYGGVRFPRSIFILLVPVAVYIESIWTTGSDYMAIAILLLILLWGLFSIRDAFRARKSDLV